MSDWDQRLWTCPACGWEGIGEQALVIHSNCARDAWCPVCWTTNHRQHLGTEHDPTLEQAEASADPALRAQAAERRAFIAACERTWLRSPDQLPELPGDRLRFVWETDEQGEMTTIRCGDRMVWREKAVSNGQRRFDEVRAMLATRYGVRCVGLDRADSHITHLWLDEG